MASEYRRLEQCLTQLENGLEIMQCQMEYRLTELPELCGILSSACAGPVGRVFGSLGKELSQADALDVSACMVLALERNPELPESVRNLFRQLGRGLGKLELTGQLRDLDALKEAVERQLEQVRRDKPGRLRCYRALGLCGGAALAIVLL